MTHRINIALEEGFLGDHVRIEVDGRLLADLDGVSTRVQIGLARSVEAEIRDGERTLMVALPARHLAKDIPLGSEPPPYVGISLVDGGQGIAVRTGDAPMGYA